MKPVLRPSDPMSELPQTTRSRVVATLGAIALAMLATGLAAQDSQEVNRLIRGGQLAAASEKVDAILARNPKDATARFQKGVILAEQGKTNEAISMFQALTEDYPELPEPYNNLASLFAAKGQYEKAKTALEMAIQTNPQYGTAYENLGDVYAKLASQAYDKALQLDKANATAQAKLAAIRGAFGASAKSAPGAQPVAPAQPKAEPAKPAASGVKPTASAPTAATPLAKPAADSGAVMQAVAAWVNAWSARDLDAYLASYSKAFVPEGKSRDEWEAARRTSFPATRGVQVSIEQSQVNMIGDSEAEVTFVQHYRSERARLNTKKLLRLSREDGAWHIAQERILR
jgi:tetratricopeptide (TPR) repeat protein